MSSEPLNSRAGSAQAVVAGSIATLRRLLAVQGVIAAAAGLLLLVRPDKGLAFAAIVFGCYLLLYGLIQLARAFMAPGLLSMQRALIGVVGVLAMLAGVLVIARPEGTVAFVAIAGGIYLIAAGCAAAVQAIRFEGTRMFDAARAVIDLIAGIALVAWPDKTVGVVAVVAGLFLLVSGVLEIFAAIALRRA
jgi:uncharacterized membrane protein HdeD (DUF308 family)